MKAQLVKYTEYNIWANAHLIAIFANLYDAVLDIEQVSSFPSLRKTLYHIWDAQSIWYLRLKGETLNGFPSKDFKGTIQEALDNFLESSIVLSNYVKNCSEETLLSPYKYSNLKNDAFTNNLCDIIHHVMNHSTFHRGQLVTMLRNIGVENIPSTDFITYCRQ